MKKLITCVVCPFGCQIQVEGEGDQIISVTNNRCRRGLEYAVHEFVRPVRTLTSSVAVEHGERSVCAVRTEQPVPKSKIWECMEAVAAVRLEAPVAMHQVVLESISGTGVKLITTACVGRK